MDDDLRPAGWRRRIQATRSESLGLIAVLAGALALVASLWAGSSSTIGPVARPEPPMLLESTLVVHVTGAVTTPGVVTVRDGARVADVVALAGGASPDAALAGLNLARLVVDGEQIIVPTRVDGAQANGQPEVLSAFRADGRLDLNLASVDELQSLSGIGPVLAQRIVEHRDRHGPFRATGDLRAVPGIGERTFQAIAELVVV